ncbi:MAG: hypothetical protein DRQ63_07080 [Gammaproteobacteria bacterium]|nr:MAG: hypothetical protein DRQ63_07080 [Gammaproteobacteria bacterium]
MALIRYVLYFFGIALFTWLLTLLEIASPGSLQPQDYSGPVDSLGIRNYSPIEIIQPGILIICGLLYAWVAKHCPSQRPIAFLFGGMALAFTIRELDFFFHRYVADNFWQVLIGIIAAFLIAYTYRQRRRFRIAWLRLWPSPGLTLLFAGAIIMFAFVRLVGHEPLWMAILGDGYQRAMKLAVEEFIELLGYFLWLIGTIEYTYQARAIAFREPQPAASRRREKRLPKSEGRF